MDSLHNWMHISSSVIGVVGVLVLIWGVAIGVLLLVRMEACRFRGAKTEPLGHQLRKTLGFYLQLGLEFLIAADIIETIISLDLNDPDLDALLALGMIVIVRTIISVSLNWELKQEVGTEAP